LRLWHTNPAPSASPTGSKTNLVRRLPGLLILPKHSTTIEIPPGEYFLGATESPSSSPTRPAPDRHDVFSGRAFHQWKAVLSLQGYLSITNSELWIFSLALDRKGQKDGNSWEWWKWHLAVPSRPGFDLSLSPPPPATPSSLPPPPPPPKHAPLADPPSPGVSASPALQIPQRAPRLPGNNSQR
jgi:hypothetical protein